MPALDGLRVLDLTQYEAGTSCTQWLGWFGADVVKIERPGVGDPGRNVAGPGAADSGYFIYWNANKRSAAIDVASPEGRELLVRMLPRYDVLVENQGPGVMEKLGLDYPAARAIHPALIYASIKGFGSSGPYSGYKVFDMVAQAAGGAISITGMPDGVPLRPGPTLADSGSGVQMAFAILAAYVQKLREGVGQQIEISMQEATTYFLRTALGTQGDWGRAAAPRTGNEVGPGGGLIQCAPGGPNDYVFVLTQPRQLEPLCRAIGRPELHAIASRNPEDRSLREALAKWARERSKHEVMKILGESGTPCGAVFDTRELHRDPHLVERGFVEAIDHEQLGRLELLGCPVRMSAGRAPTRPAPLLAAHTREVLRADLGLSQSDLDALRDRRVIDWR
jgi:formyl-CoA transferase